jgi:hypothetical protein
VAAPAALIAPRTVAVEFPVEMASKISALGAFTVKVTSGDPGSKPPSLRASNRAQ